MSVETRGIEYRQGSGESLHSLEASRKRHGLSVENLSRLSGICKAVIYRIESESNLHRVNEGVARALADALDTSVRALFRADELTVLGRTPHTGGVITRETRVAKYEVVCTTCNVAYHVTRGGCSYCEAIA